MTDFLNKISEPEIQEFYGLWSSARNGDDVPSKADFPLQELPYKMWPYLFFYNRTEDERFFCIHNGTAVVKYFGHDTTNYYMDDRISEAFAQSVRPLYAGVIRTGKGVYYQGDLMYSKDGFYIYSRILLPLKGEDGENRYIIGMMLATSEDRTYNREPDDQRRNITWEDGGDHFK